MCLSPTLFPLLCLTVGVCAAVCRLLVQSSLSRAREARRSTASHAPTAFPKNIWQALDLTEFEYADELLTTLSLSDRHEKWWAVPVSESATFTKKNLAVIKN